MKCTSLIVKIWIYYPKAIISMKLMKFTVLYTATTKGDKQLCTATTKGDVDFWEGVKFELNVACSGILLMIWRIVYIKSDTCTTTSIQVSIFKWLIVGLFGEIETLMTLLFETWDIPLRVHVTVWVWHVFRNLNEPSCGHDCMRACGMMHLIMYNLC